MKLLSLICTLLCVLLSAPTHAQSGLAPDTIYVNGTVITMNAAQPQAEAVAVLGERIVAVGGNREIRALANSQTRVVDLRGKTLLPGFYDAHSHFVHGAMAGMYMTDLNSPPIGRINTMAELIATLQQRAKETPAGQWIVGRNYDDTLLAEKRHPTRADLDRVSTEHPVFIIHISGHLGAANSLALARAGLTKDSPQPKGGVYRRAANGELTGVIEEHLQPFLPFISNYTPAQMMAALKWNANEYLSRGVTTSVIANGGKAQFQLLQAALAQGVLPLRIITMDSRESETVQTTAEAGGIVSGFGNDRLKLGAIKIVGDGSIQGYTGYLSQPYHTPFEGDANYRAYPRIKREELAAMVKQLHRAGYQIAIHGNGDAEIDDILFAFREAQKEFPRTDTRHRIEHCQMAREDQLEAMKELGITPSFFVSHTYFWGDRHRDIFMGTERAMRMSPLRSALNRGLKMTIHCDTPVTPINPLLAVWAAVNRVSTSGKVIGEAQRVTALEALRMVTIDAAWQNFEEKTKGSIETAKLADFVILADNPLTVAPTTIKDIAILETIVGGRSVYPARQR
ncbi:MAG TPA: amidohydrolase [Blastocatellia bacterium]|nr:amidohydrolase [Blastocatellia bacterium]